MSQDLLITPKADSACAKRQRKRLLQYGYLRFRFLRYQCAPWLVLAIAPLKLLFASKVERAHVQIRYLSAISRIDFASVYGLLNDLLW